MGDEEADRLYCASVLVMNLAPRQDELIQQSRRNIERSEYLIEQARQIREESRELRMELAVIVADKHRASNAPPQWQR